MQRSKLLELEKESDTSLKDSIEIEDEKSVSQLNHAEKSNDDSKNIRNKSGRKIIKKWGKKKDGTGAIAQFKLVN